MEHASGISIPFCPGRTDGDEDGGASDFLMVEPHHDFHHDYDHGIIIFIIATITVMTFAAKSERGVQWHIGSVEGGSSTDGTDTGGGQWTWSLIMFKIVIVIVLLKFRLSLPLWMVPAMPLVTDIARTRLYGNQRLWWIISCWLISSPTDIMLARGMDWKVKLSSSDEAFLQSLFCRRDKGGNEPEQLDNRFSKSVNIWTEFIIKLNVQSLKVLYDFAFKFVGGINAARCCMFSNSQENIENQPFFANQ